MLKTYLSSSSGTPKCLTCVVTIAMLLPSMKKNQKVMVAEVDLLGAYVLETLQGDLGCNRRVGGLCSYVSYQLVHIEARYMTQAPCRSTFPGPDPYVTGYF